MSPPPRLTGVTRTVAIATILVTALAAIRNNVADPDLWGHIQYGREVLETGTLPRESTWTFSSKAPWVNHENIAELALAWTSDHFGAAGLGLLKLSLTVCVLMAMIGAAQRRGAGLPAIAVVVVLAAETMQFHWHFRPHLFGFACFAALIALMDWCFAGWTPDWQAFHAWRTRRADAGSATPLTPPPTRQHTPPGQAVARLRWLWLGPVILCLWTNSHGGFAAGIAIWCTCLTLRIVEAWASWGRTMIPVTQRLAILIAAGVLATLVNPYGPQLHLWLARDVWLPRPEITDWQPLVAFGAEMWPFWILLAIAITSLWRTRNQFRLTETIVLLLVTWQALAHVRHALFFAILCGFWIPDRFTTVLGQLQMRLLPSFAGLAQSTFARRLILSAAMLWTLALSAPVVTAWTTVRVERSRFPVDAMRFLHEHRLFGRTVISFNWAQYAIGCFGSDPAARARASVAIDGRLRTCYPQEVIDLYLDLFLGSQPPEQRYRSPHSPECRPARALDWQSPDLLLLERHNPHCRAALSEQAQSWVLLYQDQLAQIWGRREKYDNVWSAEFVPLARRRIGDAEQQGLVAWPAIPDQTAESQPAYLIAGNQE